MMGLTASLLAVEVMERMSTRKENKRNLED
jgi:hypothetical protein